LKEGDGHRGRGIPREKDGRISPEKKKTPKNPGAENPRGGPSARRNVILKKKKMLNARSSPTSKKQKKGGNRSKKLSKMRKRSSWTALCWEKFLSNRRKPKAPNLSA